MADLPRLNGVIRALETGQHTLTCFAPAEINSAVAMSTSKFEGCVVEMEHNPWDGRRSGPMACQAGPRHGLLRHRLSAYFDGRGSRHRGRRLPLSAAQRR